MAIDAKAYQWNPLARFFHWLMAAALVFMVGLGAWMTDLPLGIRKLNVYALHKSIGITLLGLVLIRLLWRLTSGRPPPAAQPAWQLRAAAAGHALIYVLLFVVPLTGWLYNSAAGFPLQWFKLINLPRIAEADPALKPFAHVLHQASVSLLVLLVVGHALAALKHHFIDHDRTLSAMVPWLKPRNGGNLR